MVAEGTEGQGPEGEDDWVERVVSLAGRLGFNEVRVRWKLMAWQKSWASRRAAARYHVEQAQYENKLCPWCGGLNDKDDATCHRCESTLPSHRWQVLARLGLVAPQGWTVGSVLGLAMVAVYARLCLAQGGFAASIAPAALVRHGAWTQELVRFHGEVWRLLSAGVLHHGLWPLAWTLVALSQLSPPIEREMGRARVLFLYTATGVAGFAIAGEMGAGGVCTGAAGAVMGLAAASGVWGQRFGGREASAMRDRAVLWCFLLLVVGSWTGAVDQWVHLWGMLAGAVLGAILDPAWLHREGPDWFERLAAGVGVTLALGAVVLALLGPGSAAAVAVAAGM